VGKGRLMGGLWPRALCGRRLAAFAVVAGFVGGHLLS
jgi:hypothetical protein